MAEEALTAILVLPGRSSNSTALVAGLRGSRFRVIEASGEREAMRFAAGRPDLILLPADEDHGWLEGLEARLRAIASKSAIARVPLAAGSGPAGDLAILALAMTLRSVLAERRQSVQKSEDQAAEAGLDSLERDVRAVEGLGDTPDPRSPSGGHSPLRVSRPAAFADAVKEYESLLELGLEQAGFRVDHDVSGGLKRLASRLSRTSCGPRDVIEIHATALKQKIHGVVPPRARAYTEEARLLVLELMGHLVANYRQGLVPGAKFDGQTSTSREGQQR